MTNGRPQRGIQRSKTINLKGYVQFTKEQCIISKLINYLIFIFIIIYITIAFIENIQPLFNSRIVLNKWNLTRNQLMTYFQNRSVLNYGQVLRTSETENQVHFIQAVGTATGAHQVSEL